MRGGNLRPSVHFCYACAAAEEKGETDPLSLLLFLKTILLQGCLTANAHPLLPLLLRDTDEGKTQKLDMDLV